MSWIFRSSKSVAEADPDLASKIDHTLLRPEATLRDIKRHCAEAAEYRFHTVCVNPWYVSTAAKLLYKTGVKVGTVVGFPLGADLTEVKVYQAKLAVKHGAEEIDMVINIGALKSGKYHAVKRDIKKVLKAVKRRAFVKVILECSLLTRQEKIKAAQLAAGAGAHFVKTSTGFADGGATVEDVELLRHTVGNRCAIKASGGIHDRAFAQALLQAGATRLGTSSGPAIIST